MKFHKIRNVDKSVCTAEQKIAYNYAFSWNDIYETKIKEYIEKYGFEPIEIVKNELYFDIESYIIKDIKNRQDMKKYDIDSIIHCLRNGFIDYCKLKTHILTSYEEIGKIFYSLYDVNK